MAVMLPAATGLRGSENILLRLENPKIGGIYDAEVIGDGIAIGLPVFGDLVAQEAEHGVTELIELWVAAIVCDVFVHQTP